MPSLQAGRTPERPASQNPLVRAPRTHLAARLEDTLDALVARRLRRRGWSARPVPYAGYGGPGWVRVLARAVLAAPVVDDSDLPDSGATALAEATQVADVRGWRSFLTSPAAGERLQVVVGDRRHEVVTDRGGYVDAVLACDLEPGWHQVVLRSQDGDEAVAPVQVIPASCTTGLVSDIDDTVMVTRLPRPFIAAWNVFVRRSDAREAVPGMADLYRSLLADDPQQPVVYLSTGAWNAAPAIARFLRVHGFPPGTLLMTDWGPTNTGWFRSGPAHKVAQLRRLFTELPQVRWWLVGDDGQRDPQIYAGAVRRHAAHVRGVLIRQLTFAEHVLSSGLVPLPERPGGSRAPVPVLTGPDGHELLTALGAAGLDG